MIWRVEDEWERARLDGDIVTVSKFVAEEYVGGNSSGQAQDKQRFLALVEKEARTFDKLHKTDRSVIFQNDVALSTGVATLVSPARKHSLRYLRVFVRRGDRWLLIASQSARLKVAISPADM